MADHEHILISLEPRHAQGIYAGYKKVELRRRTVHVQPGTIVWIYEKVPVGSITGYATISAVSTASPSQIWSRFGLASGLAEDEFFSYFKGVEEACALVLESATTLSHPVSLRHLRAEVSGFQPPQFFVRLHHAHPVRVALRAHGSHQARLVRPSVGYEPTTQCVAL